MPNFFRGNPRKTRFFPRKPRFLREKALFSRFSRKQSVPTTEKAFRRASWRAPKSVHHAKSDRGASHAKSDFFRKNYVVRKMMGRSKGRSLKKLRYGASHHFLDDVIPKSCSLRLSLFAWWDALPDAPRTLFAWRGRFFSR